MPKTKFDLTICTECVLFYGGKLCTNGCACSALSALEWWRRVQGEA